MECSSDGESEPHLLLRLLLRLFLLLLPLLLQILIRACCLNRRVQMPRATYTNSLCTATFAATSPIRSKCNRFIKAAGLSAVFSATSRHVATPVMSCLARCWPLNGRRLPPLTTTYYCNVRSKERNEEKKKITFFIVIICSPLVVSLLICFSKCHCLLRLKGTKRPTYTFVAVVLEWTAQHSKEGPGSLEISQAAAAVTATATAALVLGGFCYRLVLSFHHHRPPPRESTKPLLLLRDVTKAHHHHHPVPRRSSRRATIEIKIKVTLTLKKGTGLFRFLERREITIDFTHFLPTVYTPFSASESAES